MSDKPRLLIADDSPQARKELFEILEDEFDLIEAENGEQAWSMISTDKDIKMVFTDLAMPKGDGLALLKRIRANADESVRSLPVVMMTEAHDDMTSVKESLVAGVTDLVRKPFIPELLRARQREYPAATSKAICDYSDNRSADAARQRTLFHAARRE
jgi:PleD family two-component response regulator